MFISHAREALHLLQSTRPPPTPLAAPSGSTCTYSLQDADKELLITVLLRGTKYTVLTTSLLAQPELSIQQVEDALKNEEAHRLGLAAAAAAAAVSSPVSNLAAPAVGSICAFCGRNGHTVELTAGLFQTAWSIIGSSRLVDEVWGDLELKDSQFDEPVMEPQGLVCLPFSLSFPRFPFFFTSPCSFFLPPVKC